MSGVYGRGEKIFQVIIHIFLGIFAVCAILPLIILVTGSITSEQELIQDGYTFFPKSIDFSAYKYLFQQAGQILNSYGITLFITIFGTVLSLVITPLLAYPLSRKDFRARNIFSFLVFFTMLFNGGIVPSYIMWTQIFHLKNTIWSLIFPNLLMNGFNVVLMKNYFAQNIPTELIEAAKVDGENEFGIFFRIVLPLALPVMATIGLFVGIGYWNDWTNGLYYVSEPELYSLQNFLNRMMQDIQFLMSNSQIQSGGQMAAAFPSTGIRMAISVVGILPIVVLYPFFQKYFVKGITVGAVKG
ncbi:sugar ABC transporter permease [Lachnoclostridium sp. An169]|uniref:carbohydrate ABC transporter permease n=1 Tax=Lachnoclostridium sp. An169 TaxID=1965569 RepID=UPI000B3A6307|nr:carbohydrate ABC transporter permease [Lachnoclostridium sp. An169]OUP84174.1 sugar ABC transporter permease [Lachnoclostridium sp. An169]